MRRLDVAGRTDREAAFTLVEVMVAALLLLVAMAGFVPFFLSGLEKSSVARYRSAATNIGREALEEIRQLDYREIYENDLDPTDQANLSVRFPTTRTLRGIAYDIDYAVQNSNSGGAQLKQVVVTVRWDGKPAGDPAVVSTLIHQQFLGPRISSVEFTEGSTSPDTHGNTPFPLLHSNIIVEVNIAKADYGLVYENLDPAKPRDVYLRLDFVDDAGARVHIGDPDKEYRIPNSSLQRDVNTDGKVENVRFEVHMPDTTIIPPIPDTTSIPDGYWELQAVAFNQYDQQGNVWRVRVRVEHGPPETPTLLALATSNESVELSWVPGRERDRASWVLQRLSSVIGDFTTSPVDAEITLSGTEASHIDIGSQWPPRADPWGDSSQTNYYQYRLWAVDTSGNENPAGAATAVVQLPPVDPTTTSTSSSPSTTPTTSGPSSYTVTVVNQTSSAYDITMKDSGGAVVFAGRVAKNGGALNATGLSAGDYNINAVRVDNKHSLTSSFSLPGAAGTTVLTILP